MGGARSRRRRRVVTPAPVAKPAAALKISDEFLARARAPRQGARAAGDIPDHVRQRAAEMFRPYKPADGVVPKGVALAQDSDFAGLPWAQGFGSPGFAEGVSFVGYPQLAVMAQRAEFRNIVGTIAEEMTRKWIKLKSKSEKEDKSEKIKAIEEDLERFEVRAKFCELAEHDGFFGRGHLYVDLGVAEIDDLENQTDIGDGSAKDAVSKAKIKKGSLKGFKTVEPIWTYPQKYNSSNPLADDWYKPKSWFVMGRAVHASRLLTFIGREVPDLLKAAYAFGGLSMTQMAEPYVANWLDTRQGVNDIINSFSQFVLSTSMDAVMTGDGAEDFYKRLDAFNATRSNRGIMAIDKATEDFKNVNAPLGTLDMLQAQSQEHQASVSKLPLVKLTGISPSGLNASSDGELRCHNDNIHAQQEKLFRPNLTRVINFIQLSQFGEVDPDIVFEFLPLYELTEKERAEIREIDARTGSTLIGDGTISPEEERTRVANDPDTPYQGLDPADLPEQPENDGDGPDFGAERDPADEADERDGEQGSRAPVVPVQKPSTAA